MQEHHSVNTKDRLLCFDHLQQRILRPLFLKRVWRIVKTYYFQVVFFLGTADGSILVFDVPSKGNGVKLQETLNAHDQSITELHASNDTMISGDEKGKIVVWKAGGYFQKLRVIDGYKYVFLTEFS